MESGHPNRPILELAGNELTADEVKPESPAGLSLLRLLQIADSGFPSGGFSFSNGLEGLAHLGVLPDEAAIAQTIRVQLEEGLSGIDLPAVSHAHRYAIARNFESILELDLLLTAMRPVGAFFAASTRVGRRFLESACAIFEDSFISRYRTSVKCEAAAGHHATAFGVVSARWDIAERDALIAFGSLALHGQTAAAVRLGLIGQAAVQRIIHEMHPILERAVRDAESRSLEDLGGYQPLLDIAGLRQPTLESRLFAS